MPSAPAPELVFWDRVRLLARILRVISSIAFQIKSLSLEAQRELWSLDLQIVLSSLNETIQCMND